MFWDKGRGLGFTLMECLIAMTIMVVVSFSVSYMNYSTKMDKRTTDTSLNCNQILQNTMNQISSIGRELKYDPVYETSGLNAGKLKNNVISGGKLYNSSFIKGDIINILRADADGFFSKSICGKDKLDKLKKLEVPGTEQKIFETMDTNILEDTCITIEKVTWDIDTDKAFVGDNQVQPGHCNADGPAHQFCPRPKALCTVNGDSTCTVKEPDDPDEDMVTANTRADIGFKVKLKLVVNEQGTDKEKMRCNMDRVFSFAPDTIPISFKEEVTVADGPGKDKESYDSDDSPTKEADMVCSSHNTTLTPPNETPETKIYGKSCIFYDNVHKDHDGYSKNFCGKSQKRDAERTVTATFKTNPSPELLASVFFCKVDHRTFEPDSSNPTKATPSDQGLIKGDRWQPCDKIEDIGAIKDARVHNVTDSGFDVKFSYDPKIDADHRVHLVAVDPAGNVSEIKRINFASKNCAKYVNTNIESIACHLNQWCKKNDRNPWADLPERNDPLNGNVYIYNHRKTGPKCRYYKIVEHNYNIHNDPGSKWNQFGCSLQSCCPNEANNNECPEANKCDTHADDRCYSTTDKTCGYNKCNNVLNNKNHFKQDCTQPNKDSCGSYTLPTCECPLKPVDQRPPNVECEE